MSTYNTMRKTECQSLKIPTLISTWNNCNVSIVGVRRCGRSSLVILAFEPAVWSNPLPRNIRPLWHPSSHSLPSPKFPYVAIYLPTRFGRMKSWVSCAPTVLVRDRTRASGFVIKRANHCTTDVLKNNCTCIYIYIYIYIYIQAQFCKYLQKTLM